jgi:hypothetical protein
MPALPQPAPQATPQAEVQPSAQPVEARQAEAQPAAQRAEVQLADALDLLAAAVALGLIILVATGHTGAPRILLALGFAFFVPGRAIVTNWPRVAGWSQAALPMLLSIVVLTLAATTFLWAHLWSPMALFQAEAWLSLAGLAVGAARRHHLLPQAVRRAPANPQAGDG